MIKRLDALIISAGLSTRMPNFKPLMNYQQFPFIITIILKNSIICNRIFIVVGHRSEEITETVNNFFGKQPPDEWQELFGISKQDWLQLPDRINFIYNPNYQKGMFGSVQQGLVNMKSSEWILYHFVDQPHLPISFYFEFVEQIDPEYDWLQPRYKGKNGHPIIFHKKFADHIINEKINSNMKSCSQKKSVKKYFWECDYPEVLLNFNTPDDVN